MTDFESEFEQFRQAIADGVEKGLRHDGDTYAFDVEDSVEGVLDVLERYHMLIIKDAN